MKTATLACCLLMSFALPAMAKPADSGGWLRCADFQRNSDGSWTTGTAAAVTLPGGNVTIPSNVTFPANGTYMGVQFNYLLDQQCGHGPRR